MIRNKALPLISVCIPIFDIEIFLEDCLKSVFLQDFNDFEIIIVSDASSGKDKKGRNCRKIISAVKK